MTQRIVKDLAGNRYFCEECEDINGRFLEVSEIVSAGGADIKTYLVYLCDVEQPIDADEGEILDDIDDFIFEMKHKKKP